MKNIVNAEADELVYSVSFSCQTVAYKVIFTNGNEIDLGAEYTATQIKNDYVDPGLEINRDYKIEKYLILDESHKVILNLNMLIKKLWMLHMHKDARKFGVTQIRQVNLGLSPSDGSNFRFSVAKTPGPKGQNYKAARPEKPYYYSLARQYIIEMYGAKEIQGFEADDFCSLNQTDNTILCSKDKDLNMVEGLHYNISKDKFFNVEKERIGKYNLNDKGKIESVTGKLAFYQQLLTGDSIDNIPGCLNQNKASYKRPPKFSINTAIEYLRFCKTEKELLGMVIKAYKSCYGSSWNEVLLEIADLVWMVRIENERGSDYIRKLFGDGGHEI